MHPLDLKAVSSSLPSLRRQRVAETLHERCRLPARPSSLRNALMMCAGLLLMWTPPSAKAGSIYWSSAGVIGRANSDGTGVNQRLFISGAALSIAVDEAHIYWTNPLSSSIGRANLDGTEATPNFIVTNSPDFIAVDGTHIYWTSNYNNAIGRANLDGTGVDQNFINSGDLPRGIALDPAFLYWAGLDGTIGRANLDGTGVNQTFVRVSTPLWGEIAVDGTHIYFPDILLGTIARANLDGTGVNESFVSLNAAPFGIDVDGTHIYWTGTLSGAIGRANIDGTGVDQRFVTGIPVGPSGIAVSPIPEAATGMLVMLGVLGLAITRRTKA